MVGVLIAPSASRTKKTRVPIPPSRCCGSISVASKSINRVQQAFKIRVIDEYLVTTTDGHLVLYIKGSLCPKHALARSRTVLNGAQWNVSRLRSTRGMLHVLNDLNIVGRRVLTFLDVQRPQCSRSSSRLSGQASSLANSREWEHNSARIAKIGRKRLELEHESL